MPTTFSVYYLGNLADIDTVEGNNISENASALVGLTFGSVSDRLANHIQTFSPGTTGFSAGNSTTERTAYNQNNSPAEAFSIDGGPDQIFDSLTVYSSTITYTDGTTATITAVIFQDVDGNTYLAPEFSANADQNALEAGAIRSITLNSITDNDSAGLTANRQVGSYIPCFVAGTRIRTPKGEVAVEDLSVGDIVCTRDHGPQEIRWVGTSCVAAKGKLAPVKISVGALGNDIPKRDLYVSRQHRMLLASKVAEKMFGEFEVLTPAIKLVGAPGIEIEETAEQVSYFHILLDRHEIIYAEGAPSESLLTGPLALSAIDKDAREELEALLPEVLYRASFSARPAVSDQRIKRLLQRHNRNAKALVNAV